MEGAVATSPFFEGDDEEAVEDAEEDGGVGGTLGGPVQQCLFTWRPGNTGQDLRLQEILERRYMYSCFSLLIDGIIVVQNWFAAATNGRYPSPLGSLLSTVKM